MKKNIYCLMGLLLLFFVQSCNDEEFLIGYPGIETESGAENG